MNPLLLQMLIKYIQQIINKQKSDAGYRGELNPDGTYMDEKGKVMPTDQGGAYPPEQVRFRLPVQPPMLNIPYGYQPQPKGQLPPEKEINA